MEVGVYFMQKIEWRGFRTSDNDLQIELKVGSVRVGDTTAVVVKTVIIVKLWQWGNLKVILNFQL